MLRAHRIEDDGSISAHGVDIAAHVDVGAVRAGRQRASTRPRASLSSRSRTRRRRAWHDVELDSGDRHLRPPDKRTRSMTRATMSANSSGHRRQAAVRPPMQRRSRCRSPSSGAPTCRSTAPRRVCCTATAPTRLATSRSSTPGSLLSSTEGVVYAHAHIRGGGEGGRRWWLDGQLGEQAEHVHRPHRGRRPPRRRPRRRRPHRDAAGCRPAGCCRARCSVRCPIDGAASSPRSPSSTSSPPCSTRRFPLTVNEWDEWGDPSRPDELRVDEGLLAL